MMDSVFTMFPKIFVLACLLAVSHTRYVSQNFLSSRIIGGRDAEPGEFPHQASLQAGWLPLLAPAHFCGGTILNEQWILTAAHCVDGMAEVTNQFPFMKFYVAVGKSDLSTPEDEEQTVHVEKSFKHPMYPESGDLGPGDIALLKLETPLELNKGVATAKLPEIDSDPIGDVILSGWGAINNATQPEEQISPNILQTATLTVIDRSTCTKSLIAICIEDSEKKCEGANEVDECIENAKQECEAEEDDMDSAFVCTGPLTGGISGCSGDSGGPLISKNENNDVEVVGVASWAVEPCGRPDGPTGFTRVGLFVDWINKTMQKN